MLRLRSRREEIVAALQWEICKNDADAAKELMVQEVFGFRV